jgi:uncharacterized protein
VESAIGQHFHSPRAQHAAVGLGVATIALDFLLAGLRQPMELRFALALVSTTVLLILTEVDLKSAGLRGSPQQGWRTWARLAVILGLIVAVCLATGFGIVRAVGGEIPIYTVPPSMILPRFLEMCVVAPVLEETIYRLIACVSLVKLLGVPATIAVNGVVFGSLHFVYGVPSPENLVGGFVLAWAYLKSGSITVPVLLHSGGNLLALTGQAAGWYLMSANG